MSKSKREKIIYLVGQEILCYFKFAKTEIDAHLNHYTHGSFPNRWFFHSPSVDEEEQINDQSQRDSAD